ncbi:MAG: ABC transporter permease [Thermoleophilia bacterium]|nr:ABC transporter permease [Thermoleophilia bacterium]
MRTLRNLFRRRLRVMLTIFGITIGVLALVVMGGMAEKMGLLVDGGTKYYSDKVVVGADGSLYSGAPLSLSKADDIRQVPGVAEVTSGIGALLDPDTTMSFGMPPMFDGSDMRGEHLESFPLEYAKGRALTPDDLGCVVLGSDMVKRFKTGVGDTVTIRGEQFTVVGTLEPTLTAPDTEVFMTLPDAQRLFIQDLPAMVRNQVDQSDLVNSMTVYPTPGTDPEALAARINEAVDGVEAMGPSAFQEQIASFMGIFNAIIYGIAIIALFVGGLSVINTMTMSVNERTREIGVRKAIGASDRQIVGQFLTESGVIGLIGGVSGLFLGWLAATVADKLLEGRNLDLFLISPRLAIGSVLFAIFLGLASGLYPSFHAARLQPVLALRYE